ncbi:hypothetical protein CCP3SC15_3720003 [Gammaproteobacteria bacterium]
MAADRKTYMREYMRNRRKQARERLAAATVVNANQALTEDRYRAIVREEIEQALGPLRELLTGLAVDTVNRAMVEQVDPVSTHRDGPESPKTLPVDTLNSQEDPVSSLTDANVNGVSESVPERAEPIPYWKPDPREPSDPRCQAVNRDGSRCKCKSEVVIKALDREGRWGEFTACKRHQADFRPHPSLC